mmetsp:Transcript_10827/g.25732  ORF Transcript_10827/g.25732 Transcript_10827/m.25732 type:complete len:523 (+) Transcript_10827:236-1804(+)
MNASPIGFTASCMTTPTAKVGVSTRHASRFQFSRLRLRPQNRGSFRILAAEGRSQWDFGRFVRTVTTFNPPPSIPEVASAVVTQPLKILKRLSAQEEAPAAFVRTVIGGSSSKASAQKAVLLVAPKEEGALGLLEALLQGGGRVRAVLPTEASAEARLRELKAADGAVLEVANAPPGKPQLIPAQAFKGTSAAVAWLGGLPDSEAARAWIRELARQAKPALGLRRGEVLFAPGDERGGRPMTWAPLDDVVMGGCSLGGFEVRAGEGEAGAPAGVFSGNVSTDNSGGFSSVRTLNLDPPLDLSAYEGISLRVRGDGLRYKFILRTDTNWDTVTYCHSFDTASGEWQDVRLPFAGFRAVFRAKTLKDGAPLDPSNIVSLQLMLSKFEYDGNLNPAFRSGKFSLPVSSISAYRSESDVGPRLICVAPAGGDRRALKAELEASGLPFVLFAVQEMGSEPSEGGIKVLPEGAEVTGVVSPKEVAGLCLAAMQISDVTGGSFGLIRSGLGGGETQQELAALLREAANA